MTAAAATNKEDKQAHQPETAGPVELTRTYHFTPATVFAAWTKAEHVKRWFAPDCFTVPEARVDCRVGGAFDVCMRAPNGADSWMRGHFLEVVPNARLVFESVVNGQGDAPLFKATTTVTFEEAPCGSRVHVSQSYVLYDPIARQFIGGAMEGWTQTLGRLDAALEEDRYAGKPARSVVHATFRLERRYRAAPAKVFHALTDPVAKAAWFTGDEGYTLIKREMDVRPGGREYLKGSWNGGQASTFDAVYHDVVPNERLVYAYHMFLGDRLISVSLATFELKSDGDGTQLVLTEQGAFLDGYDDAGSREKGTNFLLDALGRAVEA